VLVQMQWQHIPETTMHALDINTLLTRKLPVIFGIRIRWKTTCGMWHWNDKYLWHILILTLLNCTWWFMYFIMLTSFFLNLFINTLLTIIEIISMSGINSGHHNLPTYEMSLKSDNVEFVQYCGGHFENGFLTSKNFYPSLFSKWPPQYCKNSTLFDFKGSFWFIYTHFVCCWFAVYR
jgi:hypothetical protein